LTTSGHVGPYGADDQPYRHHCESGSKQSVKDGFRYSVDHERTEPGARNDGRRAQDNDVEVAREVGAADSDDRDLGDMTKGLGRGKPADHRVTARQG
jgi:hypothetical protein